MSTAAKTMLLALLVSFPGWTQITNPRPQPAPIPQVEPPPPPPAPMPPVQAPPPRPYSLPVSGMPAPPPPGPKPGLSDPELNELIQTVMAARITKELGLNDEQTVLMVRRLGELREQVNAIKKQRQEALRDLRVALKAGKPDAEIQPKLERLMALDQQSVNVRLNAYQRAAENLTLVQRAKLYIFFSDFPEEMRRLAQKARERARGLMGPDERQPLGPQGLRGRPLRGPLQKTDPERPEPPAAPSPEPPLPAPPVGQ